MDDIYEKLRLLNYEIWFSGLIRRPQVTRVYFAQQSGKNLEQFKLMLEICHWIIHLIRNKGSVKQSSLKRFDHIQDFDTEEKTSELI